jgi:hypothetical protein
MHTKKATITDISVNEKGKREEKADKAADNRGYTVRPYHSER